MTKQVLISLADVVKFMPNIGAEEERRVRNDISGEFEQWFNEQEDMTPTLEAIDDMDLWDDIQFYINETKNEKSTD